MTLDKVQMQNSTVDVTEIDKFARLSESWWDTSGPFRPLHALNPARLSFIHDRICQHFNCDPRSLKPFKDLNILDIGCGGGLLCEPVARLGARTTGIDAAHENIAVAQQHADLMDISITYRHITAEHLVEEGQCFDVIITMEVIEHVADVTAFLKACFALLKPGGLILVSTLNRTLRSYLTAVIGAEYILRWLPPGTHDWQKFLTPDEFKSHLLQAGFIHPSFEGMTFDIIKREWAVHPGGTAINYLGSAQKPD